MFAPTCPVPTPDLSAVLDGSDARIARGMVRKMRIDQTRNNYDDALQVARTALVIAARTFDPTRGRKWAGWACTLIRQALRDWLASQVRAGFVWVGESPLERGPESRTHDLGGRDADPSDIAEAGEAWALVDRLDERSQRAVRLHFAEGLSFAEVAKAIGVSRELVRLIVGAALDKLRSAFAADDGPTGPYRRRPGASAEVRRQRRRVVSRIHS